MYLNDCICNEFLSCQKWKKMKLLFFRPKLCELGLFHTYFVCKYSFRYILIIFIIILGPNKLFFLILKKQKSKFKNKKIMNYTFNIHKYGKKTGIQPILKSNSTSFMLNNCFSGMNLKKVTQCWSL